MHIELLITVILLSEAFYILLFRSAKSDMEEAEEKTPSEERDVTDETRDSPAPSGFQRGRDLLLPVVQLVVAIAMALFIDGYYHSPLLDIATVLFLTSVLWVCAWTDVKKRLIPNRILLLGLLVRVILFALEMVAAPDVVFVDLLRSVTGAGILFAVSMLCRLVIPKAIGYGDVKLLMLLGFYLGTDRMWGCVFLGMIAALVYSVTLLITKRATMKTEIPYAPFLLAGTVAASFLVSV